MSYNPVTQFAALSTGVLTGGLMSVGSPANTFNITQASAYMVDWVTNPGHPSYVPVTIPAQTVTVSGAAATRVVNWWVSDINGNISALPARPTDSQRRTMIQLGITGSTPPGGNIFSLQALPVDLQQKQSQFYDLLYNMGPFSASGNMITPNANLTFNKAVGSFFAPSFGWGLPTSQPNDPHLVTAPAETPAQFLYATQSSVTTTPVSTVDVANYDVGGVITPIPGGTGTSVIHRIWLFGSGIVADQMIVQYGQTTYGSLSAAQAAVGSSDTLIPNPSFPGIGNVCAWIVATKSCTALNNTSTAVIAQASKFPAY